jgi:hypothetical protein
VFGKLNIYDSFEEQELTNTYFVDEKNNIYKGKWENEEKNGFGV